MRHHAFVAMSNTPFKFGLEARACFTHWDMAWWWMASWRKQYIWISGKTGGYSSLLLPFPDQFDLGMTNFCAHSRSLPFLKLGIWWYASIAKLTSFLYSLLFFVLDLMLSGGRFQSSNCRMIFVDCGVLRQWEHLRHSYRGCLKQLS